MSVGGSGRMRGGNLRNPCLTMHQPWASLLVCGIKRVEGRSWAAPIRGRLWIHAAGKVPDPNTIKAMEDFYREIYALNGITDVKFPENYPVSRLIGCVEVVGCVKCEELLCWEEVPVGARFEGQTDFCWLCEQPQKLVVPFEMRGYQGVYNLERKIYEAAVRGLSPMQSPFPVKFPLPDPSDRFSLKPGSLKLRSSGSKSSEGDKSASLSEAIDGARSAATQFSKQQPGKNTAKWGANLLRDRDRQDTAETSQLKDNGALEEYEGQSGQVSDRLQRGDQVRWYVEQNGAFDLEQNRGRRHGRFGRNTSQHPGASSKTPTWSQSTVNGATEEYEGQSRHMDNRLQRGDGVHQYAEQNGEVDIERSGRHSGRVGRNISQQPGPSSKICMVIDCLVSAILLLGLPSILLKESNNIISCSEILAF